MITTSTELLLIALAIRNGSMGIFVYYIDKHLEKGTATIEIEHIDDVYPDAVGYVIRFQIYIWSQKMAAMLISKTNSMVVDIPEIEIISKMWKEFDYDQNTNCN